MDLGIGLVVGRLLVDAIHLILMDFTKIIFNVAKEKRKQLFKLRINLFEMIKEPFKQLHTQPRLATARRGANGMHGQLRKPGVHGSHTRARR